jgi:hypothetical protein
MRHFSYESSEEDPELFALPVCLNALGVLDEGTQRRAVRYLHARIAAMTDSDSDYKVVKP